MANFLQHGKLRVIVGGVDLSDYVSTVTWNSDEQRVSLTQWTWAQEQDRALLDLRAAAGVGQAATWTIPIKFYEEPAAPTMGQACPVCGERALRQVAPSTAGEVVCECGSCGQDGIIVRVLT